MYQFSQKQHLIENKGHINRLWMKWKFNQTQLQWNSWMLYWCIGWFVNNILSYHLSQTWSIHTSVLFLCQSFKRCQVWLEIVHWFKKRRSIIKCYKINQIWSEKQQFSWPLLRYMYQIMYVKHWFISLDVVFSERAVWYSVIVEGGVRKVLHVVAQTLNFGTTPNIASV